jgi:hypothetical protein
MLVIGYGTSVIGRSCCVHPERRPKEGWVNASLSQYRDEPTIRFLTFYGQTICRLEVTQASLCLASDGQFTYQNLHWQEHTTSLPFFVHTHFSLGLHDWAVAIEPTETSASASAIFLANNIFFLS